MRELQAMSTKNQEELERRRMESQRVLEELKEKSKMDQFYKDKVSWTSRKTDVLLKTPFEGDTQPALKVPVVGIQTAYNPRVHRKRGTDMNNFICTLNQKIHRGPMIHP